MWEKDCPCCGQKFDTPETYEEHVKVCNKPVPKVLSLIDKPHEVFEEWARNHRKCLNLKRFHAGYEYSDTEFCWLAFQVAWNYQQRETPVIDASAFYTAMWRAFDAEGYMSGQCDKWVDIAIKAIKPLLRQPEREYSKDLLDYVQQIRKAYFPNPLGVHLPQKNEMQLIHVSKDEYEYLKRLQVACGQLNSIEGGKS